MLGKETLLQVGRAITMSDALTGLLQFALLRPNVQTASGDEGRLLASWTA